ncbi:hypothetical protein V8F33_007519 [Rhypophila sp. PSN 637]
MLPTGIWCLLLWLIGIYSFTCLAHDRTPLWPTRRLKFQFWRRASWCSLLALTAFVLTGTWLRPGAADGVTFLQVQLLASYVVIGGFYIPEGIFSYLVGTRHFTGRGAKRADNDKDGEDAEKCSTTEIWIEEDVDRLPPQASNVEKPLFTSLQPGRFRPVLSSWDHPYCAIFLIFTSALLAVWTIPLEIFSGLVWAEVDSLKAYAETWFSGGFPIIIIIALSLASIRYTAELLCAQDGDRIGGVCDGFMRAFSFFVFFHFMLTAAATQGLIAYVTGSISFAIVYVLSRMVILGPQVCARKEDRGLEVEKAWTGVDSRFRLGLGRFTRCQGVV